MRLISHSLTAIHQLSGIQSLIGFGNLAAPRPFYPQVIPGFFNRRGCGPPRCLTTASACSWIGHPVSGLIPATSYALFRLALAAAPELQFLNLAANINSPDRSTKSTRSSINGLSVLVGTRFQVLFHSPPGVLFTFPSRYCSTIGH